jgi:signal transduction histidine kinase
MSGYFYLDWFTLTISIFNTIVLLWLGFSILLNAEKRRWGIWMAGAGMLAGGLFFISHSAILGHGTRQLTAGLDFWWRVGWLPVLALPTAWYVILLWFSGGWEYPQTSLWKRQRVWFGLAFFIWLILLVMLLTQQLPGLLDLAANQTAAAFLLGGIPLFLLIYPLHLILCISLALDALWHPEASGRFMGELARRRARPWLTAVSITFLFVGFMVAAFIFWLFHQGGYPDQALDVPQFELVIVAFDLVIAVCIGAAVVMLGKAIISYEIFTGKALPRQEMARYWSRMLVLAAGYSLVLGWAQTFGLRPIYGVLLGVLILAAFFAMLSWRMYHERQLMLRTLRPFLVSQRLMDRMALIEGEQHNETVQMFDALCRDVLGVRQALLVPRGALLSQAHGNLGYPAQEVKQIEPDWLPAIESAENSQAVDPRTHDGFLWVLPLRQHQELLGVLLLGEKTDGGFFTQEEMEMAGAAGERILDSLAGTELAQRLVQLQRRQIAESQVADTRLHRNLHDEVLPAIHEAVLKLNHLDAVNALEKEAVLDGLSDLHHQVSSLLRGLKARQAFDAVHMEVIPALHSLVEDELQHRFEGVAWDIQPEAQNLLERISPVIKEVLYYAAREALRNAARHARKKNGEPIRMQIILTSAPGLRLQVIDDGSGFAEWNRETLGTDGSGQGLMLHATLLSILGGQLRVTRTASQQTCVEMELPQSAVDPW